MPEAMEEFRHARTARGEIAAEPQQARARDSQPVRPAHEERLDAIGELAGFTQIDIRTLGEEGRQVQKGFTDTGESLEKAGMDGVVPEQVRFRREHHVLIALLARDRVHARQDGNDASGTMRKIGLGYRAPQGYGPGRVTVGIQATLGEVESNRCLCCRHEFLITGCDMQMHEEQGDTRGPTCQSHRLLLTRRPVHALFVPYCRLQ